VFLLGIGLASIAVFGLPKLHLVWQARQHRAAEAEQVSILRAVFDPHDGLDGPGRTKAVTAHHILIDRSIELHACHRDGSFSCVDMRPSEAAGIPLDLRLALIRANSIPQPLPDPELAHVSLKPESETTSPFMRGVDLDRAWRDFRAIHGAGSYWRASRAVVSENGSQALIYVEVHCGGLCGTGMLILLSRSGDKWTVTDSDRAWIS
jgi:hypothetical protein